MKIEKAVSLIDNSSESIKALAYAIAFAGERIGRAIEKHDIDPDVPKQLGAMAAELGSISQSISDKS